MAYEKPQKGNPHRLTVKQHMFPARSIARFVSDDDTVAVFLVSQSKIFRTTPDDQIFCARRVWDERAETTYMKSIEDNFQQLAESIIAGTTREFSEEQKQIINDFYALWNIRAHWKDQPISDQPLSTDVTGLSYYASKDEQELLEKNHISVIEPDHSIPGRMITGVKMQQNLFLCRRQLADAQWGVLRASQGEFLVPDNFSNARIVPLTPKLCLYSPSSNDVIRESEVLQINQLAVASSREWYFAQDLSNCPR